MTGTKLGLFGRTSRNHANRELMGTDFVLTPRAQAKKQIRDLELEQQYSAPAAPTLLSHIEAFFERVDRSRSSSAEPTSPVACPNPPSSSPKQRHDTPALCAGRLSNNNELKRIPVLKI